MVLFMPRPFKHKVTGVYWLRQRTPANIKDVAKGQIVNLTIAGLPTRRTVGAELVVSLHTKEPSVAKQRAVEALEQFKAIWAAFENPPAKLQLKEVVALAGEAFRLFQAMEDDPAKPDVWRNIIEVNSAAMNGALPMHYIGSPEQKRRASLQGRFAVFVDGVLRKHKLRVDDATYGQLLEHTGRALTDAAELLLKRSEGDYSPDDRGQRYPEVVGRKFRSGQLTFNALIAHKQKTQTRSANTFSVYQAKLKDFAAFIGHDDPRRVTKDEVRRWRDNLRERGLAKKTINDQFLAALKAVLNHGVKEFDLPINAAHLIRDERSDPAPRGSKGYSDEQARTILAATFKGVRKNISLPYRRATFWAPWICAYTGLRVGEVTQLQGSSLLVDGNTPYLIIRPEDGGTKGGNAWTTGIHQHLIDLGLLEMFRAVGDGPLFYAPYEESADLSKVRRHRSKDAADRVADWIKEEVGINAPLGRPSHAWRHSFTTISRSCRMDKEARDYMMGSRSQTDAREGYGDWTPAVITAEINKMPRFGVTETDWRPSTERMPAVALRGSTPTKRVRRPPNRRKKTA